MRPAVNTPEIVQAARCKFEHKIISRIGYDAFKQAKPYIDELIQTLSGVEPVTPRRVTLPGEAQSEQDPWKTTPMQWQLSGQTVDVAVAQVLNN